METRSRKTRLPNPPQLRSALFSELTAWRSTRSGGQRIPEPLWTPPLSWHVLTGLARSQSPSSSTTTISNVVWDCRPDLESLGLKQPPSCSSLRRARSTGARTPAPWNRRAPTAHDLPCVSRPLAPGICSPWFTRSCALRASKSIQHPHRTI